jgi:hypothetical protein
MRLSGARVVLKHFGSDGFDTGIPGICDECFQKQKPSERYFCEHNKRLAVFSERYWETARDVEPDGAEY